MGGNLSDSDQEYYQRRERQERERAAHSLDMAAKRLHGEMAERYSILLGNSAATPR